MQKPVSKWTHTLADQYAMWRCSYSEFLFLLQKAHIHNQWQVHQPKSDQLWFVHQRSSHYSYANSEGLNATDIRLNIPLGSVNEQALSTVTLYVLPDSSGINQFLPTHKILGSPCFALMVLTLLNFIIEPKVCFCGL
jgi:hypothetical protein